MNITLFYIIFFFLLHQFNSFEKKYIENKICEVKKDILRHINCYYEVEDESLIDLEPIDVVIKYIDLSDKNLVRKGIPQLKKDNDNGEIKYCVCSILQNMPWVNKIFIVMPNEKVKFFKDYEEIKEKIIYIKDKDLVGFDSASCTVFEFNFWRLKKFGMVDNFIYFNDDYFVGNPLKKTDFFYVENGRIVPYILGKTINKNISKSIIEQYYYDWCKFVSKRK